jgi:hypothetical protein
MLKAGQAPAYNIIDVRRGMFFIFLPLVTTKYLPPSSSAFFDSSFLASIGAGCQTW